MAGKARKRRATGRRVQQAAPVPVQQAPVLDWEGVVRRWFAGLAMKYHPDRGGTNAVMAALNHARDALIRLFREANR
jgi:hypothetical protein